MGGWFSRLCICIKLRVFPTRRSIPCKARSFASKSFSKSAIHNSNIPEKRIRMILSKKELSKLHEDNTDVYKRNMVDRYLIRPKDIIIENPCHVLFNSLKVISCKQNQFRKIHNQKNWQINFLRHIISLIIHIQMY